MDSFTVRPTTLDEDVAGAVASHTDRQIERGAEFLTWGADEHILLAAAALGWLATRRSRDDYRILSNHLLVCSAVTALAPHLMKRLVNQKRPDRLTVEGHLHGIPWSGKADDAFPSGHAMHVGAIASAATLMPAEVRNAIWAASTVLVSSRVELHA
jgi:undecaprenyl-diphosphatase